MKAYKELMMEILEIEEDIVRMSGIDPGDSSTSGGNELDEDPANIWDDTIPDFGAN